MKLIRFSRSEKNDITTNNMDLMEGKIVNRSLIILC